MAISVALIARLVYSAGGLAFRAVREDETAAEAMGIATTRVKVEAFVVASFFAGVAGALFAHAEGYVHTNSFTFVRSFEIMAFVVLGGLGSLSGAALAAAVLTAAPELLRGFGEWRMVLYSLLIIATMLVRPQGLLGSRELSLGFLWRRSRARAGALVMALLELAGITVRFGGVVAIAKLDLRVDAGTLVAMIGPNGAGKTTGFNVITGVCPPTEGSVLFDGERIDGRPTHQICRLGIARTFQNIRLFRTLSALENVLAAQVGAQPLVARRPAARRRVAAPRGAPTRRRRASCSSGSASTGSRMRAPTRCPTASSAGSRSRARSRRGRACCCSTSPPRA